MQSGEAVNWMQQAQLSLLHQMDRILECREKKLLDDKAAGLHVFH
jgi:hypothetical protein